MNNPKRFSELFPQTVTSKSQDYTAFEVFAHNVDIPVGECADLGGYVTTPIPASMTHRFVIRSEQSPDKQNTTVDWGDGTIDKLSSMTSTGDPLDQRYDMTHTYATPGKYIVKICGDTYFALIHGYSKNGYPNLMCRVFDIDLPVASHIANFSSFAKRGERLIKLNIFNCANFHNNWNNISNMFGNCVNLKEVTGFRYDNKLNVSYNGLFSGDTALETADFYPVRSVSNIASTYSGCTNLAVNIGSVLALFDVRDNSTISVKNLFNGCVNLTGTVPANRLWKTPAKNVTWTNTESAFAGCSDEIRAQVPTSWGGTNEYLDIELAITDEMKVDYTAFEVVAHTDEIPVGESSVLGGYVNIAIPGSKTHSMIIRGALADPTKSDVIIDWGDGVMSRMADGDYASADVSVEDNECDLTVEHTYATDGKYIIKIYGKDYYNVTGLSNSNANKTKYNLLCRVFDKDLPIASNVINLAGYCKHAHRLLKVTIPSYFNLYNVINFTYLCMNCQNLTSFIGLDHKLGMVYSANAMFQDCFSLTNLEFTIPTSSIPSTGIRDMFKNMRSFEGDINDLIPDNGFVGSSFDVRWLFYGCVKMTGVVPADKLWNNKQITWLNTSACFTNCSDEIRRQVPVSWGGLAPDEEVIQPSSDEVIEELRNDIMRLRTHLGLE